MRLLRFFRRLAGQHDVRDTANVGHDIQGDYRDARPDRGGHKNRALSPSLHLSCLHVNGLCHSNYVCLMVSH